jgi:elongator complex protein 3
MSREQAVDFIISALLDGERNLEILKRKAARKYHLSEMIKKPEILERFPRDKLTPEIRALLLKKPAKTLSGVTPVAIMIRPEESCRFKCIYCPFTGLAAKSYTGFEPAAMRARDSNFDPFLQASGRVAQYDGGGHPTDKCEVIIMGGTFLGMDDSYKQSFIKGVYDGLNNSRAPSLEDAKARNEKSSHRVVGLTIETRPDMCVQHIDEMLSFGATRVELGVQHADDNIYKIINRGHTVDDVIKSTKALKDAAFKVLYHIMPGLPGSSPEKDADFVKTLFSNPDFRPDMLKVYPTLVMEGTQLHSWLQEGKYKPYTAEQSADVISEFFRYIPEYVRVMRIQRDIPAQMIGEGVKKSNLRELVDRKMAEKGISPREIRSREVRDMDFSGFEIRKKSYDASGGKEHFISYENNMIAGFIRMRFPGQCTRTEITDSTALIRELHVYGSSVPLSKKGKVQHTGMGAALLKEAESIAQENGMKKMVIISGVGAREYYSKHGYSREGPYMSKPMI